MKYFICDMDDGNCRLGIPAEMTERVITADRVQSAVCETENGKAFVSVPALFRLKDRDTPHALVLKRRAPETVLLTPRVDIELDIPEDRIHPLPKALTGIFRHLTGICFNGEELVLILDPVKLLEGTAGGSALHD